MTFAEKVAAAILDVVVSQIEDVQRTASATLTAQLAYAKHYRATLDSSPSAAEIMEAIMQPEPATASESTAKTTPELLEDIAMTEPAPAKPNKSRQLQGKYLALIRQFGKRDRERFSRVCKARGRAAAIREMKAALKG